MALENLDNGDSSLLQNVSQDLELVTQDGSIEFSETSSQLTSSSLQHIITTIENNPEYNDPPQEPRISELLKKGDYVKAITKIFDFIGAIMNKGMAPSSHISFEKTAKDLNFTNMDTNSIQAIIKKLTKKIQQSSSITKSLHFTSILSRAKDAIYKKESTNDLDAYDLLSKNVQEGDILLINKRKDTSFGAQALRAFDEHNPADYTHSMLISRIDSDGTVRVTQSTQHRESGPGSGVEEIRLEDYFNKHRPSDILTMNQKDPYKTSSLQYAKQQIGKGYDNKVALVHAFSGVIPNSIEDQVANNDKFNCVELIAKSYKNNPHINHFSHPNDFLG